MDESEIESLLTLAGMPELGSIKIRLLIDRFGSPSEVLKAPLSEIESLPGFGSKIIGGWEAGLKNKNGQEIALLAERSEIRLIAYTNPLYPKQLLELADFPLILYLKGTFLPEDRYSLAVVGTRQATLYGQEMAGRLSKELAQADYTIVSGLARGIDTAAHVGALEGGRTIAVLGSGHASVYPPENADLAEKIARSGAVISEFPPAMPPAKHHFPQRNRIVAALTEATILIEAPLRSGAMLTAGRAIDQGKPVFALPGRADIENFRGNHALIKEKKAALIEGAEDILSHFNRFALPLAFKSPAPGSTIIPLESEEQFLFDRLPTQELSVEEIIERLGWPAGKLNVLLMSLVLKKRIKEYPGKIYRKIQ